MQWMKSRLYLCTGLLSLLVFSMTSLPAQETVEKSSSSQTTYKRDTVIEDAADFFGTGAEGLGEAVARVFDKYGEPNAIIKGNEASGAFVVGARYGDGMLQMKAGPSSQVYWTGPSVGYDAGGNVSKVYVLIYHLPDIKSIFQRFPAIDGSLYFIGGLSVNYHQDQGIILAPIRLGAGLRAGVNVGYMHYTPEKTWNPL